MTSTSLSLGQSAMWPARALQPAALPQPAVRGRLIDGRPLGVADNRRGMVQGPITPYGEFEVQIHPLWLRAQAGDEAAYRECLTRIAQRLRGYLRRRMQALPDEVEDLVQEVLLALHVQRGTYDARVPVTAWVLAIARHKWVDLLRRKSRRDDLHDTLDDVDETALVAHNEEAGTRLDLQRLLLELPHAQRQAIMLTKLEGLSVIEASQHTGASVAAIKVQVHRGLKRLALLVQHTRRAGVQTQSD